MAYASVLSCFLLFLLATTSAQQQCSTLFPYAVQQNSDQLNGMGITCLPANAFATTDPGTNLGEFQLEGNPIQRIEVGAFNGLSRLQGLFIEGSGFAGPGLKRINSKVFDPLTALQTLSLNFNGITYLARDSFEKLTSLTSLNFVGNSLSCTNYQPINGCTCSSTSNLVSTVTAESCVTGQPLLPLNTPTLEGWVLAQNTRRRTNLALRDVNGFDSVCLSSRTKVSHGPTRSLGLPLQAGRQYYVAAHWHLNANAQCYAGRNNRCVAIKMRLYYSDGRKSFKNLAYPFEVRVNDEGWGETEGEFQLSAEEASATRMEVYFTGPEPRVELCVRDLVLFDTTVATTAT